MIYDLNEVIRELEAMLADSVVDTYAIGGAIAASLYGEVSTTEDVDVFVNFPNTSILGIIDPSSVIRYFTDKGYEMFEDKILIGNWPVQFLPPPSELEKSALQNAIVLQDGDLRIRVMTREYIAAIALSTNRSKDKSRLIQLRDAGGLDMGEFETILVTHKLLEKWADFQKLFPPD